MRRGHPRFYELIDEICELHARKNADYAKDSDPLSNFHQCESFGIPAWKGTLVRMGDKWSRITELAKGKAPQNESLRDSLIDLAIYSLIDIILLEECGTTTLSKPAQSDAPASSVKESGTRLTPA